MEMMKGRGRQRVGHGRSLAGPFHSVKRRRVPDPSLLVALVLAYNFERIDAPRRDATALGRPQERLMRADDYDGSAFEFPFVTT